MGKDLEFEVLFMRLVEGVVNEEFLYWLKYSIVFFFIIFRKWDNFGMYLNKKLVVC